MTNDLTAGILESRPWRMWRGILQSRLQPCFSSFVHKIIVIQFGIGTIDSVDLLTLTRAKSFVGIQAPDALKQTLPPQHFMQAGNAASELVRGIEKRCIAVGYLHVSLQNASRNGLGRK